ncbi:shikimate dehydrogenase [Patescibacteria group bacterium]|nr:shikimate dehydrogenase [Patescibacteria group bacterium]MBU1015499.1 shikimate dehydrogenase [Patescibacteria group bacterium]MBU1685422.1 shikimate dehydrogenase [Patescibacteria group bacterium]MBU1938383.1 shikimate dehydrogenase [Patescibacteria group bacterium]
MTKIYGIVGHPVGHSLSPAMHNAALKAEGIDAEYRLFDIDQGNPEDLANFCYETDLKGIAGFSVTMPYKEAIMDYMDNLDVLAKEVSSVNTVKNEDFNLNGYNTDVTGAIKALQEKAKIKGKKALVLGAGGVARAIIYGLREFGVEVHIFNRTVQKAKALAKQFDVETIEFRKIKDAGFDIIVNATPVGMFPNTDESLLKADQIKKGSVVMDIITHPIQTQLLKEAKKADAETISGERMLLHQAADQFVIWFNRPAPYEAMEKALYEELAKRA